MRKGLKRLVALVLSFSMVLGSAALIFANEKPTVNYVSIGASNTNGYGLIGYLPDGVTAVMKDEANVFGYLRDPKGCYPDLFSRYLAGGGSVPDPVAAADGSYVYNGDNASVHLLQLAMSSMRIEEARVLLDNDYYGDEYTKWRFTGKDGWFYRGALPGEASEDAGERAAMLQSIRDEYQNAVKSADYITVDLGTNNFGVYLTNQIIDHAYSCDLSDIDPEYAVKYDEIKSTIKDLLSGVVDGLDGIDDVLDAVVYAIVGYCYNFDKVIAKITELNESEKLNLIVLEIQNVIEGLQIKINDTVIPFDAIFQAAIDIANAYILVGSPCRDLYSVVDLHNVDGHKNRVDSFMDELTRHFAEGCTDPLSANMKTCFTLLDDDLGPLIAANTAGNETLIDAACEALAAIMYKVSNPLLIDLSDLWTSLMDGSIGDVIREPRKTFENYSLGLAAAAIGYAAEGYELPVIRAAIISELEKNDCPLNDSLIKSIGAYHVKTGIGNSFFSHPSDLGHQQITEEIIKTVESDNAQYIHSQGDYYLALGGKTALGQGLSKGNKSYVQLIADELGFDAEHTLSKGTKKLSWTNAVSYIKANEAAIKKASLITYNPDMAGMISEAGRELILGGGNLGDYVDPEIMSFVDDLLDKAYGLIDEYITNGEAISNELDKLVAGLEPELKSLVYDVLYENETVASILGGIKQETVDYLLDLCIGYVREILGSVQKTAGKLTAKLVDTIATTAKRIVYVAVAYCAESSKAVGQIISYNPSATVLLIGMYNPLRNLEIGLGSTSIDLGNFLEYIIRLTDDYGVKIAKKVNNNKFAFVDVSSARTGNEEIHFDVLRIFKYFSYMTSICKNAYVSADGHADIKNAVMACLEVKDAPLMLFAPVRPAAEEPEQIEEAQEIEKTEPSEEGQEQAPQQEHESLEEKQIEETVIIGDAAKLVSGGMKLAKGIAKLAVNNAKRVLGFFFGR